MDVAMETSLVNFIYYNEKACVQSFCVLTHCSSCVLHWYQTQGGRVQSCLYDVMMTSFLFICYRTSF